MLKRTGVGVRGGIARNNTDTVSEWKHVYTNRESIHNSVNGKYMQHSRAGLS